MTLFPSHVLVELVEFGIMTLAAFWGVAYGWWHRRAELTKGTLPRWRRIGATVGLLAVTVQALLYVLSWVHMGRNNVLFGQWERLFFPAFLLAAPCVLVGKGASRWWLFSSSV